MSKEKVESPLDDVDAFMNPKQLEYFKTKLINWRDQILRECSDTITDLQDNQSEADIIDAAAKEADYKLTLRARNRDFKLLRKIEEALLRIDNGTYGYCEETGEPISLKRLDARPIATLGIEAQERHEREERTHRDI
ncbi:MAG: RNA polymerase-binding protein DksA [Pseudomonadota bacterium]|jgi:DnaK suppressor protein|nr:RNA polymerase-binding protein DksA [Alphaproteobacteria bacterium]